MEPEYSLKNFFKSPFPVRTLPYLTLIFGFLGFLDATYLTIQHYMHAIPPCTIGGCETVLTSKYAMTLGLIPTSVLGVGFYLTVMVLAGILITIYSSSRNETGNLRFARKIISILFLLSSVGLLVGIFLVLLQAFVIHAWCYYCLFSELIDFLLFDTSWWLYNNQRN